MLPDYIVKIMAAMAQDHPSRILQRSYQSLQNKYRHRDQSDLGLTLTQSADRLAYLNARFPATYAVCNAVLGHLQEYSQFIKTVLDLGCGPGSGTLAALSQFQTIESVMLVDQNLGFREFIEQALSHHPINYQMFQQVLPGLTFNNVQSDLVILSYVLNELNPVDQQYLATAAWQQCNQFFVIIEPGTPSGYANILRARDQLIRLGAVIIAPCPHHMKCPLNKPDWCHFSCRLPRVTHHKQIKNATLNYEDEKYSYLIVTKNNIKQDVNRVIKKPILNKGHVLLDTCGTSGIKRTCISKAQPHYRAARHIKWGDNAEFIE